VNYHTWIFSVIGSVLIGLCGVLPVIIVPFQSTTSSALRTGADARLLHKLLSFAVGGLLGDVFLHLLPEAWELVSQKGSNPHESHITLGLWVLCGIFTFIFVEMLFSKEEEGGGEEECEGNVDEKLKLNNNEDPKQITKAPQKHIAAGYLNLLANSVDNFAHGLAVAGSFLVSPQMGALTTVAILLHEVPHELGDFAILLRAGFNRWEAARAQLLTATVGILGALAALAAGSSKALGDCTCWILPFTAGGFIHISLVSVLPDLLKEDNPIESFKQVLCILSGVAVMYFLTMYIQ